MNEALPTLSKKKKRGPSLKSWIYNKRTLQKSFEKVLREIGEKDTSFIEQISVILGKIKVHIPLKEQEKNKICSLLQDEKFADVFITIYPDISFSQLQFYLQKLITNSDIIKRIDDIDAKKYFSFYSKEKGKKINCEVLDTFGEIEFVQNIKTGEYSVIKMRKEIVYSCRNSKPKIFKSPSNNYMMLQGIGVNTKPNKYVIFSSTGEYIVIRGYLYCIDIGATTYFIDKAQSQIMKLEQDSATFHDLLNFDIQILAIYDYYVLFLNTDNIAKIYDISKEQYIFENISIDFQNKSLQVNNTDKYGKLFFLSFDHKIFIIIDKETGEYESFEMKFFSLEEAIDNYFHPYSKYDT